MRRLLTVFCVTIATLSMGIAPQALAHKLATDGKISAFLHIDPNDEPHVGTVNDLTIYYNDANFMFDTVHCNCRITINEGTKVLYSGTLPAIGNHAGKLGIFIPKDNFTYDVLVTGRPLMPNQFQPFNLKFDIDVGDPSPVASLPVFTSQSIFVSSSLVVTGAVGLHILFRKFLGK
jgi:hypothetical protein